MGTKKKSKKLYYIFLPFVAILLALGIAADVVYPQYRQVIDNALGTVARAPEEYVTAALENSKDVNIRLQEEGSVLLKNDNDVLPIDTSAGNTPINVYGILSAHHYKGGTGSGTAESTVKVTLKDGLAAAGFKVNDTLWNMLASKELGFTTDSTVGAAVAGQYELAISEYEKTQSFAEAKSYSQYAIITFGSNGGEDSDGDRNDDGSNSNQLGPNEKALLKRLHDEGFKVISLMNGSYIMETAEVVEYSDAVLWIGGTGLYGPYGVANILAGKANPSGRTVDTWMYDSATSSTYYTTLIPKEGSTYLSQYVDSTGKAIGSYTNYNEGIYVGYKWYETADKEGYWDKAPYDGYDSVVAFPFGYGLSYTDFSEKITNHSLSDGVITIEVEAENLGRNGKDVAGKDVIELYVEKPYTNGGVEVPVVELVAFDKTALLNKDGKETVTLTVDVEYLASYDSSANGGAGCYVLAGGDYNFYLASATTGAHCWKEFANDETRKVTVNIEAVEYSGANKRESDSVVATNKLEVTNNDTGVASNDSSSGFKELSRANGFANANQTISKAANSNQNVTVSNDSAIYKALTANYGNNSYTTYNTAHLKDVAETTNATLGAKKQYVLSDLYTTDANGNPLVEIDEETGEKTIVKEVDYDDPRWEALLSQMSVNDLVEFIGRGGYGNIGIDSIGKLPAYEYDGPTGFSNFLKASLGMTQETTGFCSEPIIAATWDVDLVEEFGAAVGTEGNAFNNNGWYAPGMNMHRTTFGGRTGEYFSEDSFITGMMAGSVAAGAFSKGVYTYAKHFAFNEIETHRSDGMNCVMSEQTAREIYLRPFEIAIKQGKLTGLMSSFMLMNAQWNGGNYNLMTGIVRKEWNFKGVVNTDLAGKSLMGAERALCAGTDMLLNTNYNATNKTTAWARCDDISKTDEGICAMKTAAKHILYAYASAAIHRDIGVTENNTGNVKAIYICLNILGYVGAAALLGLFAWRLILDLKSKNTTIEVVGADGGAASADGEQPLAESDPATDEKKEE